MEERLSDKVSSNLRKMIISGELKDNTFLSESEIALMYGISKAPVKAALQALTQEGYLICFPRRGYMVSSVSVGDFEKIRELRKRIELLSIELAIERASDKQIESLREFAYGRIGETNPYETNNTKFHLRLAEITHNQYVTEVLLRLLGQTARYAIMKQIDDSAHIDIIDALLSRDKEKAFACMEKDLNPHD
jgi:DNA-binding GntR family transcriptional regulator